MSQANRVAGISQKYDGTLDYGIVMYDNLPYQRNADVCNSSTVALYSGHIIKYYLCINHEEGLPINNRDDEIQDILRHIWEEEEKRRAQQETKDEVLDIPTNDLTDEQLHALTTDRGEMQSDEEENESDEASGFSQENVINLDDIEDW